jgi:predicted O-methyltransferase YrrM
VEHFYQSLEGWFDYEDVYRVAVERAPESARFLEIGTWYGRSLAFLVVEALNSGKAITIDAVDPWKEPRAMYDTVTGWITKHGLWDIVTPFRAFSYELSAILPWNQRYDFVFVDGDHHHRSVLTDLRLYAPRMRPGGVMAGHDLCDEFPGVLRAVTDHFGPEGKKWERCSKRCWRTLPGVF